MVKNEKTILLQKIRQKPFVQKKQDFVYQEKWVKLHCTAEPKKKHCTHIHTIFV